MFVVRQPRTFYFSSSSSILSNSIYIPSDWIPSTREEQEKEQEKDDHEQEQQEQEPQQQKTCMYSMHHRFPFPVFRYPLVDPSLPVGTLLIE